MNPPDGVPSPNTRLYFWIILGSFVTAMTATAVFGWWVVAGARKDADHTDKDIRLVAWWSLCYADAHDGSFPPGWDELLQQPFSAQLDSTILTTPPMEWPTNPDEAGLSESIDPGRAIEGAREIVSVQFDAVGGPPRIGAEGRSYYHGTLDTVNRWLQKAADRVNRTKE